VASTTYGAGIRRSGRPGSHEKAMTAMKAMRRHCNEGHAGHAKAMTAMKAMRRQCNDGHEGHAKAMTAMKAMTRQ